MIFLARASIMSITPDTSMNWLCAAAPSQVKGKKGTSQTKGEEGEGEKGGRGDGYGCGVHFLDGVYKEEGVLGLGELQRSSQRVVGVL
jgi:hypothetical protein